MSEVLLQTSLLDAPTPLTPAGKPLTTKQALAWNMVRSAAGGITAEEVGSALHALRGRHPAGELCLHCGREGLGVLRSKAVGPLVIRRRLSGRYEPRDPAERVIDRGSQLDGLPGDSWADLFGEATT